MRVGLDVGSTTIKCVVLDDRNNLIYHTYERHYSHIVEKSAELLRRVAERCGREAVFAISGSAGMGMAESVKAPFVQEVFATRVANTSCTKGAFTLSAMPMPAEPEMANTASRPQRSATRRRSSADFSTIWL